MLDLNKETLLAAGFVDVAAWHLAGEGLVYKLDGERAQSNALRMQQPNALYAFVRDEAVQYIGKTTRSVRNRSMAIATRPRDSRPTCAAMRRSGRRSRREPRSASSSSRRYRTSGTATSRST
jgi:hypothetical protein